MTFKIIKYVLEGLVVALAAFFIPQRNIHPTDILIIAFSAATTLALLDNWSPGIAMGTRQGAGFGIGYNITNDMTGGFDVKGVEGVEGVEYLTINNVPYDMIR